MVPSEPVLAPRTCDALTSKSPLGTQGPLKNITFVHKLHPPFKISRTCKVDPLKAEAHCWCVSGPMRRSP